MDFSRRWFIGGSLASLAFGGCRFFSAPAGTYSSGVPKMSFGVISDVHILYDAKGGIAKSHDTTTLEHTLAWFRDQGVDAVMIAGDIADKGIVEELQAVADTWFKVFPDNKASDGRHVEKVFVSGNHDMEGFKYGDFGKIAFPDPAERAKHLLATDFKANWRKIFHEDYSEIYSKCVKGYTFVGQHWGRQGWGDKCKFDLVKPFMEEKASKIVDPSLPFFYAQHPHPNNTCYGAFAWGRDTGVVTETLGKFPNAVAFSGHSHYSLLDERSIWQGSFTSIGTCSLRYTSQYREELPSIGYENTNGKSKRNLEKTMPKLNTMDSRQGLLVKVYGDCMVVLRREFISDEYLGEEWVLPLSTAESRPFEFASRAKKSVAPEFPAGGKIRVAKVKAENRKKVEKDSYAVSFPKADAPGAGRIYDYEIAVEHEDGTKAEKRYMISVNHNKGPKTAAKLPEFTFKIACDSLSAKGKIRFAVYPRDCFCNKGKPLFSDWICNGLVECAD